MIPPTCPPPADLEQFLAGTLPDDASASVADHLDGCVACQMSLDRLSSVTSVVPVKGSALSAAEMGSVDTFLKQVKAIAPPDPSLPSVKAEIGPPPELPGYEIVSELGRGGMGVVYKAVHRALNRTVAVKMILSGLYPADADRTRFRSEAEAIARLQHPNIVQLFEVGETDGRPFLSLEYVPGGTLQQRTGDRPQQPTAAARIVEVIARAVGAAHAQQIVHRDLKPQNVLLAPAAAPADDSERLYGIPKLTDFGLAKRMDSTHPTLNRTVSGTPSYMAPEQVPEGVAAGPRPRVGPAADIYALGAVLYQLLTGRPPFAGPDWVTTLLQVVRRDPVPVRSLQPGVPRDLETICLKCLEKDPARRYPTADALANDLAQFLARKPIVARPVGPIERTWKWARRHPVAASSLGAAFAGLCAAVVFLAIALTAVEGQRAAEAQAIDGLRERERAANQAREREERLRVQAEEGLYLSRISQANLLWRDADLARTRQTLAGCAPSARQWEWGYLNRLCYDGLVSDLLQPGYEVDAVAAGSGWVAAAGSPPPAPGSKPAPATIVVLDDDGKTLIRGVLPVPGRVARLAAPPGSRRLIAVAADPRDGSFLLAAWNVPETRESGLQAIAFTRPCGSVWDLSPEGSHLASATPDGVTVQMTGPTDPARLVRTGAKIAVIALCPGGTRIATAGGDKIQVWDVESGRELAAWAAEPRGLAISPTGDRIAYFDTARNAILVRSVATPDEQPVALPFEAGAKPVELAFAPDGGTLLAPGPDGVRVWELATKGQSILAASGADGIVVRYGPVRRLVATAGDDGTVRVWNLGGRGSRVYRGHAGPVRSVAFSADGQRLVTGGRDGSIVVWDLTRPQDHIPIPDTVGAESTWFTPDGQLVALGRSRVTVHHPESGIELDSAEVARSPESAAFASAARLLVVVSPDRRTADVWSLASPIVRTHQLAGHVYPITAVAASADGRVVVTGSAGLVTTGGRARPVGEVCVWDAVTGKLLHRREEDNLCVSAVAVPPDGRLAAVATGWPVWDRPTEPAPPSSLRTFIPASGSLRPPLASDPKGADPYLHLAFHPGGGVLAAIATRNPGTVIAFDLGESKVLWEAKTGDRFAGLAFFPEGSRIAVANRAGAVAVFDTITGGEAIRLVGPGGSPLAVARPGIDPTGRFLAVPGPTGVSVWESSVNPDADRPRWRTAFLDRSRGK